MLVANNSFDLWQKDVFFSAAEEVQDSADIMESVYRTWVRERREGVGMKDSDELRRELQTALGTAKWQLEEFEKAVRWSHGYRSEDNTATRHKQFIAVMEDQISRVETALREFYNEERKEPLRWINLDEEERDDLAAFLSGTPGTSYGGTKDECVELVKRKDENNSSGGACQGDTPQKFMKGFKEVVTINKDSKYVVELEAKEIPGAMDDSNCQSERLTGQRKTWSTPNFGSWKIVIADEDDQRNTTEASTESEKCKGLKSSFWRKKGVEQSQVRGLSRYLDGRGISRLTQLLGQCGVVQRQSQSPRYSRYSCSLQVKLFLMLTIFFIVPFLFYAT